MNEQKPFFLSSIHNGTMLPFAKTESERSLIVVDYAIYVLGSQQALMWIKMKHPKVEDQSIFNLYMCVFGGWGEENTLVVTCKSCNQDFDSTNSKSNKAWF